MNAAVSSVVEDSQPTGRPSPGELPSGYQWSADIVASVNQHAGDTVKLSSVADELVLLEEGRMPPIVCNQPGEPQAELWVLVTRVSRVPRRQ